ncbi:MAG: hypothetical protein K2K96_09155 [Lachnospiraceae bacterium]|nr:hypothetical protein [Lachnospiraceae bacterium]
MNQKKTGNHKTDLNPQTTWQKPLQLLMIAVLFLCWLSVGLYYLISEPKDYSAAERRRLATAPALTFSSIKNGYYLSSMENYVKDQFPARDSFRNVKTASSLYGFLRLQDNGYAIRDGHLTLMDMTLNESSVTYACTQMQYLYDTYLADSGCHVYYCIVPDKNYYLQLSDPSYPTLDYDAMESQIHELLDFATPIDISNDLTLSSFFQTDTHWKQESIVPAANTILSAMSADDRLISSTEEYHIETALNSFHGVLCGNMGWNIPSEPMRYLTNDRIQSAEASHLDNLNCNTVYDPHYLTYDGPGADPYSFFLSGSSAFVTIKNTAVSPAASENSAAGGQPSIPQSRELVVFRDSFGSSIAPLFLAGYDQITLIDTRYINPSILGDYITFTDQDVLFLYSTLLINSSYSLKAPL